jgi:hypothetical protein
MSFESEHANLVAATNARINAVQDQTIAQITEANAQLVAIAEQYDAARLQLESRYGLKFRGPAFASSMRNRLSIKRPVLFPVMTASELPGSAWTKVK